MNSDKPRPVRLQRSRAKGARLISPNGLPVVCVTRPSKFGNPFRVGKYLSSGEAAERYREWLRHPHQWERVIAIKKELRGKNLACFCSLNKPCHADILLEIANA